MMGWHILLQKERKNLLYGKAYLLSRGMETLFYLGENPLTLFYPSFPVPTLARSFIIAK